MKAQQSFSKQITCKSINIAPEKKKVKNFHKNHFNAD